MKDDSIPSYHQHQHQGTTSHSCMSSSSSSLSSTTNTYNPTQHKMESILQQYDDKETLSSASSSSPMKIITLGLLAILVIQYRDLITYTIRHNPLHRRRVNTDKNVAKKEKTKEKTKTTSVKREEQEDDKKMKKKKRGHHRDHREEALASESALSEDLLHAYKVKDTNEAVMLLRSLRGKQSPGTIIRLLKPWGNELNPEWVVDLTLSAQGQVRHLVNVMLCNINTNELPGTIEIRKRAASAVLEGCIPVGRDLRTWIQYFNLRDNTKQQQQEQEESDNGDDEVIPEPILEDEILESWILGMMVSNDKSKARDAAQALSVTQLGDKWIPQEELNEFMDHLLTQGRTDDLPRLFKGDKFIRIQKLIIEGMEERGLIKQAIKAMQSFGMTEKDFPTVAEAHYRKRIKWCISSGDVDLESYIGTDELEAAFKGRPSLQEFWCEQLIEAGHTWLAIDYYRSFPNDDIKEWYDGMDSIKEQIQESEKDATHLKEQYDAENNKFFERETENHLSLKEVLGEGRGVNDIHIITTTAKLRDLIDIWEKDKAIIGLDSEWSTFRLVLDSGSSEADLVQLATSNDVYLVDVYKGESGLIKEIGRLVESDNIIVVGFGIAGDLRVLRKSGMTNDNGGGGGGYDNHRIVDLNDLADYYLPPRKGASKHQRGLTEVVKYFIGKPLSKAMRMSNWRKRPLSYRQMEYAALDALVLPKCIDNIKSTIDPELDLWHNKTGHNTRYMRKTATAGAGGGSRVVSNSTPSMVESDTEMDDEEEEEGSCYSDNTSSPSRREGYEGYSPVNRHKIGNKDDALTPVEEEERDNDDDEVIDWVSYFNGNEAKLVCPGGMGRLVRKLRGLGIDTLELDSCEPAPLEYIAETQNRAIVVNYRSKISKRKWCNGVKCYVLPSTCDKIDDQLAAVMQEFNVEVDPDSLLGRCVVCNARDWIVTTDKDMVKDQVQPMTLKLYNKFYICGGCGKVYWEGIMFEKAVTHLRKFVNHDRLDNNNSISESDGSSGGESDERTRWARALRDGRIDSTQARRIHDRLVSDKLTATTNNSEYDDPLEEKTLECIAARNKDRNSHNYIYYMTVFACISGMIYGYIRKGN